MTRGGDARASANRGAAFCCRPTCRGGRLAEDIRNARGRQAVTVVLEEIDRMARIIEDLLLLTRLDDGMPLPLEPVEVELVMREAILRGTPPTTPPITLRTDPALYALADHERLLRVLTNLVANASQHAGRDVPLTLRAERENGRVIIEVSDAGAGIPPESLPHVFERFYRGVDGERAHKGSAGLGLPIAALLVHAMKGEITVDSTPGAGTTFHVSLPAGPDRPPSQRLVGRQPNPRPGW